MKLKNIFSKLFGIPRAQLEREVAAPIDQKCSHTLVNVCDAKRYYC